MSARACSRRSARWADVHLLHRTCHNGAAANYEGKSGSGAGGQGERQESAEIASSAPGANRGTSNIAVISILRASILARRSSLMSNTLRSARQAEGKPRMSVNGDRSRSRSAKGRFGESTSSRRDECLGSSSSRRDDARVNPRKVYSSVVRGEKGRERDRRLDYYELTVYVRGRE